MVLTLIPAAASCSVITAKKPTASRLEWTVRVIIREGKAISNPAVMAAFFSRIKVIPSGSRNQPKAAF